MSTLTPNLMNQLNDALAAIRAAEASMQRIRDEIEQLKAPCKPPLPASTPKGPGFWINGKWTPKWTAAEIMVCIFSEFSRIDPSFPDRFAHEAINNGRTRKHVSRTRDPLYQGRPDLSVYSKEFAPGWFIGTNENNSTKRRLIRAAATIMGYTTEAAFWFRFP